MQFKIQNTKRNSVVFHNGSTYDYHFIINKLAKEFDSQLECLGENAEKYITFSAPIKKKLDNNNKTFTYKLKFIDSFTFMLTSLSSLVDNSLKVTEKNAKDARKEEKSNRYAILLGLKITN